MYPYNRLSVRSDYPDQTIREVAADGPTLAQDLDAPRLIILIHGYQNSEPEAHRAYDKFRDALRRALYLDTERDLGVFWEFYWPGDNPNKVISVATYAARVPDARESGRLLAEFLSKRNPRQKIFLVGHSLGCRVALDAVRTIRRQGDRYQGATVRGLFLMAAAVPVSLCLPRRLFDSPIPNSPEYAFYSHRDIVLSRAFPPGQQQYGESGIAVGSYGQPAERWEHHEETETNLRHKDYWGSSIMAEQVGRYLGYTRNRAISYCSTLPDWQDLETENKLEQNTIRNRTIPTR